MKPKTLWPKEEPLIHELLKLKDTELWITNISRCDVIDGRLSPLKAQNLELTSYRISDIAYDLSGRRLDSELYAAVIATTEEADC